MKKFLTFITFIAAGIAIAVTFLTSTTYIQLVIATLLYPPLAYFAFALFPRKNRTITASTPIVDAQQVSEPVRGTVDIVDIDKRAFLKLIGAAGLSFFLFSLFSRRAESLFLGRAADSGVTLLKNPEGKEIYPAEQQPTDGYQISEIDDDIIAYYGFTNKEGQWIIMKQDANDNSFRYVKGSDGFPNNWGNRKNLTYEYFYNIF